MKNKISKMSDSGTVVTLVKELKEYFDTKLDAMKDQFTEKNEKWQREQKLILNQNYAIQVMRCNTNLIISQ